MHDLILNISLNPDGTLWTLTRNANIPVLFCDKECRFPYTNPIIFNHVGDLPTEIYMPPSVNFDYMIFNKVGKLIKWGSHATNPSSARVWIKE